MKINWWRVGLRILAVVAAIALVVLNLQPSVTHTRFDIESETFNAKLAESAMLNFSKASLCRGRLERDAPAEKVAQAGSSSAAAANPCGAFEEIEKTFSGSLAIPEGATIRAERLGLGDLKILIRCETCEPARTSRTDGSSEVTQLPLVVIVDKAHFGSPGSVVLKAPMRELQIGSPDLADFPDAPILREGNVRISGHGFSLDLLRLLPFDFADPGAEGQFLFLKREEKLSTADYFDSNDPTTIFRVTAAVGDRPAIHISGNATMSGGSIGISANSSIRSLSVSVFDRIALDPSLQLLSAIVAFFLLFWRLNDN